MNLSNLVLLNNMELLIAFVLLCIITSITPGPNNLMLLTSGVNFGIKRTIPHSVGISVGFLFMLFIVGTAKTAILNILPNLGLALKILGSIYLLYLAYRISFSRVIGEYTQNKARPLTFMEAALFQWTNPKAWTMAISAMTVYGSMDQYFVSIILVSIIFAIINWPCVLVWAVFGNALRNFLNTDNRLKWFNIVLGIVLVLSIIPIMMVEI